jgi:hypothetical protein
MASVHNKIINLLLMFLILLNNDVSVFYIMLYITYSLYADRLHFFLTEDRHRNKCGGN